MSKGAGHFPRRRAIELAWLGIGFAILAELAVIALRHMRASWWALLGLLFVAAGGIWLEHRSFKEAVPFVDGSIGERRVGRELSVLERDGYRIIHGLKKFKRADVDHVVVGPSGIFAIETKAWNGRVDWRGGRFLVSGRDQTKKIRKAVSHAVFVRKRLPRELQGMWVEAVTTLTKTTPRCGCRKLDRMWVIPLDDLVGFIRSRGRRLTDDQINAVDQALKGISGPDRALDKQRPSSTDHRGLVRS